MRELILLTAALLASLALYHAGKPKHLLAMGNLQVQPQAQEQPIRYSGKLRGYDRASLEEIAPPERYRGPADVIAHYVDQPGMIQRCGNGPAACARVDAWGQPHNTLPNPCDFRHEYFAALACHEKGHTLGWSGEHGA